MAVLGVQLTLARSAFAAAVCLCTTTSFAALQPVSEAPVAAHIDTTCRINSDTSTDCKTAARVTILRPSGRELLSRIDFDYRENDRLEVKNAAVIQPDGERVPLLSSQIDTRSTPNPVAGLLRQMQTSLAFPGLRVGSTVTYEIVQHTAATPLAAQFHEVLRFRAQPVRFDSYRVEYVADRPVTWRAEQADDFRVEASEDGKRLSITLKRPRYFNIAHEDDTVQRRVPRIELGSSESAQDHFDSFARRYSEILAAPLPPGAADAVQAAQGKPDMERVAALMRYVDTHYRYLGDWRASERGYIPFDLAQIEANGYGDCKDLATLLAAMLNASGIDAKPAWTYAGPFAPSLLIPGISAPNHAVVRAVVDGNIWWLDPTRPYHVPGRTFDDLQDRWAFVVERDGGVREDYIKAESPVLRAESAFNYRFEPDGSAQVNAWAYADGTFLQQITEHDRSAGASAVDQALCSTLLHEPDNCIIERPSTDKAWSGRYRLDIKGRDRRALERLSGKFMYDGEGLAFLRTQLDSYARYRQNRDVGDIYLRDASIVEGTVQLEGVDMPEPIGACQVQSPWYDLHVKPGTGDGGASYSYRVVEKLRWLSHEDLTSRGFGDFIDEARRCVDSLRQTVSFELPRRGANEASENGNSLSEGAAPTAPSQLVDS
jgi:transglutaminase-like putative cysteine protease